MEEIKAGIKEIITKITKREIGEIHDNTRLAEDLGMKSVSRIELSALLEEKFDITIGNFEIRKPKTLADLVSLVRTKL